MIDPKEHEIDGQTFIFHKFPATEWRRIVSNYPLTGLPKIGEYETNHKIMLELMKYVAVPKPNGEVLFLTNEERINGNVKPGPTLVKVEWGMLQYNCDFLQNGRISGFLDDLLEALPEWITKTLIQCSETLSKKDTPPSTN